MFDNDWNSKESEKEPISPATPVDEPAPAPSYFKPEPEQIPVSPVNDGRPADRSPYEQTPVGQNRFYSYTSPDFSDPYRQADGRAPGYAPVPGYPPRQPLPQMQPSDPKSSRKKSRVGLIVTVVVLAFLLLVMTAVAITGVFDRIRQSVNEAPEKISEKSEKEKNEGKKDTETDDSSDKASDKGTTDNVIYGDKDGFDNKGANISGEAVANAANYCVNSVVAITTSAVSYNAFYGDYVVKGAGSGVLWAQKAGPDGTIEGTYIVTNNHVVANTTSISVTLSDGIDYEAKLVGTDAQTDIAVILIDATDLGSNLAAIGDSSSLLLGQTVIAIGNPLGKLAGTVTCGIIGCLEREINVEGTVMHLLQTDAAISPGNSGGGLFDMNGRLVGIVNAKTSDVDVEGITFAVPVNTAKAIASDLIANGFVTGRPMIGVTGNEVTASNYNQYQNNSDFWEYITGYYYANNGAILEGWYVLSDDSVSYVKDGERFHKGDVICAIDGKKISGSTSTIAMLLRDYEIGDTVTVTVWRLVEKGGSAFRRNYSIQSVEIQVKLIEMAQ